MKTPAIRSSRIAHVDALARPVHRPPPPAHRNGVVAPCASRLPMRCLSNRVLRSPSNARALQHSSQSLRIERSPASCLPGICLSSCAIFTPMCWGGRTFEPISEVDTFSVSRILVAQRSTHASFIMTHDGTGPLMKTLSRHTRISPQGSCIAYCS